MKIHTKALLDTSGFPCTSMAFDAEAGRHEEREARAVFITEGTVQRARAAQKNMHRANAARLPELRYGDILISRVCPKGGKEGVHIPAGRDAGILVSVTGGDGYERNIPFTGLHMLAARQRLLAVSGRGQALTEAQRLILEGIQGTLEIIAAQPDPKRFSPDLIGQAFMCSLIDRAGKISTSITDEEFGRKARADVIRAQITAHCPDHPDGLSAAAAPDLDEILQDLGLNGAGRNGDGSLSYGGIAVTEDSLKGMISSNDALCKRVFGSLTATPVRKFGTAVITSGEFELLADELSGSILSGDWVQQLGRRAQEITGAQVQGYEFEMMLISVDGLDIMAIRDTMGAASGQALLYSWPSADRIPLSEHNGGTVLNISPEEIPQEQEIQRLTSVLDAMIVDQVLEGELPQARAIRMA